MKSPMKSSKAKSGAAYTEKYVNQAGHSEHQLGLAVDLSSLDKDCKANFSRCSLKKETAAWLANNTTRLTDVDHHLGQRRPLDRPGFGRGSDEWEGSLS